jgi:hypothetical protein
MLALQLYRKGLVSRKDGHFTTPFPGYFSIGLLQIHSGHTCLDALLEMTTGEPDHSCISQL